MEHKREPETPKRFNIGCHLLSSHSGICAILRETPFHNEISIKNNPVAKLLHPYSTSSNRQVSIPAST